MRMPPGRQARLGPFPQVDAMATRGVGFVQPWQQKRSRQDREWFCGRDFQKTVHPLRRAEVCWPAACHHKFINVAVAGEGLDAVVDAEFGEQLKRGHLDQPIVERPTRLGHTRSVCPAKGRKWLQTDLVRAVSWCDPSPGHHSATRHRLSKSPRIDLLYLWHSQTQPPWRLPITPRGRRASAAGRGRTRTTPGRSPRPGGSGPHNRH